MSHCSPNCRRGRGKFHGFTWYVVSLTGKHFLTCFPVNIQHKSIICLHEGFSIRLLTDYLGACQCNHCVLDEDTSTRHNRLPLKRKVHNALSRVREVQVVHFWRRVQTWIFLPTLQDLSEQGTLFRYPLRRPATLRPASTWYCRWPSIFHRGFYFDRIWI